LFFPQKKNANIRFRGYFELGAGFLSPSSAHQKSMSKEDKLAASPQWHRHAVRAEPAMRTCLYRRSRRLAITMCLAASVSICSALPLQHCQGDAVHMPAPPIEDRCLVLPLGGGSCFQCRRAALVRPHGLCTMNCGTMPPLSLHQCPSYTSGGCVQGLASRDACLLRLRGCGNSHEPVLLSSHRNVHLHTASAQTHLPSTTKYQLPLQVGEASPCLDTLPVPSRLSNTPLGRREQDGGNGKDSQPSTVYSKTKLVARFSPPLPASPDSPLVCLRCTALLVSF